MNVMLVGYLYMKAELKGYESKAYNIFCGYKLYDVTAAFGSGRNAVINATVEEVEGKKSEYKILNAKRVQNNKATTPAFVPVDCDAAVLPRYTVNCADSYKLSANKAYTIVTKLGNYATVLGSDGTPMLCTGKDVMFMCDNACMFTNFAVVNSKPKMGFVYDVPSYHSLDLTKSAKSYALDRCVEQFKLMSGYQKSISKSGQYLTDNYLAHFAARFKVIQDTGVALQRNLPVSQDVLNTFTAITDNYLMNVKYNADNLFNIKPSAAPSVAPSAAVTAPKAATTPVTPAPTPTPVTAVEPAKAVTVAPAEAVVPAETVEVIVPAVTAEADTPAETVEAVVPALSDSSAESTIEEPSFDMNSVLDTIAAAFETETAFEGISLDSPTESTVIPDQTEQSTELEPAVTTQPDVTPVTDASVNTQPDATPVADDSAVSQPDVTHAADDSVNTQPDVTSGISDSPESNIGVSQEQGEFSTNEVPVADDINIEYAITPQLSYMAANQVEAVTIMTDSACNTDFIENIPGEGIVSKRKWGYAVVQAIRYQEESPDLCENIDTYLKGRMQTTLILPNAVITKPDIWFGSYEYGNSFVNKVTSFQSHNFYDRFPDGSRFLLSEVYAEDGTAMYYYVMNNVHGRYEVERVDFNNLAEHTPVNATIKGVKVEYLEWNAVCDSIRSCWEMPQAVYKYSSKPEYGVYGYRDIYGNPKILKEYEIGVGYVESLTNQDLQYIYNWINDNIFATTLMGRLPDLPVSWVHSINQSMCFSHFEIVYMASSTGDAASTYNLKKQQAGVGVINRKRANMSFEPVGILINDELKRYAYHSFNRTEWGSTFYSCLFMAMLQVAGATTKAQMKEIFAMSDKIKDFLGWDIKTIEKAKYTSVGGKRDLFTYTVDSSGFGKNLFWKLSLRDMGYLNNDNNWAHYVQGKCIKSREDVIAMTKTPKTTFASTIYPMYKNELIALGIWDLYDVRAESSNRSRRVMINDMNGLGVQRKNLGDWVKHFPFDLTKAKVSNFDNLSSPDSVHTKTDRIATSVHDEVERVGRRKLKEYITKNYVTKDTILRIEKAVNSAVDTVKSATDLSAIPSDFDVSRYSVNTNNNSSDNKTVAYACWCIAVQTYPDAVDILRKGTPDTDDSSVLSDLFNLGCLLFVTDSYLTNESSIPKDIWGMFRFDSAPDFDTLIAAIGDDAKDIYYTNDLVAILDEKSACDPVIYKCLVGLSILKQDNILNCNGGSDLEFVALSSFIMNVGKASKLSSEQINKILNSCDAKKPAVQSQSFNNMMFLTFVNEVFMLLLGHPVSAYTTIDFNAIYRHPLYQKYHNPIVDMTINIVQMFCFINSMPADTSGITEADLLLGYFQRIGYLYKACMLACDYKFDNLDPEFIQVLQHPDMLLLSRVESKYSDLICAVM